MSDTLISYRPSAPVSHSVEQPTAPMPPARPFVEVLEATRAPAPETPGGSILDLINALLMQESVSKGDLHALRARLRRYSSQMNVLMSQLRALQRGVLPAPSSTISSRAPSTSSSCHLA